MTTTTTKTVSGWWHCGRCGFKNHPRLNADNAKCEQCGAELADTTHPHTPYRPEGA